MNRRQFVKRLGALLGVTALSPFFPREIKETRESSSGVITTVYAGCPLTLDQLDRQGDQKFTYTAWRYASVTRFAVCTADGMSKQWDFAPINLISGDSIEFTYNVRYLLDNEGKPM